MAHTYIHVHVCLFVSRETLLGQLTGYVRSVREEFTTKSSYHPMTTPSDPTHKAAAEQQATPTGKNMPDVVKNIVWCHQLEPYTNDIVITAEYLLGELAGFERFQGEANELKDELRAYQREQVDSWSRQVLAAIDHPSEPLG